MESPHCTADRCSAVRGEYLSARVYITSDQAHNELMVRPFVFIGPGGGGIGIELPTTPPHDNVSAQKLFIMRTVTNQSVDFFYRDATAFSSELLKCHVQLNQTFNIRGLFLK